MPAVEFEVRDGIATITINRPEVRNAMNPEVMIRLLEAWSEVRSSDAIRVAILTGAGDRAFCAGADLAQMIPLQTGAREPENEWDRRWLELRGKDGISQTDTGKPMISAINGHAMGGGMELVQATDIRVAVPEAKLGVQEVKWGLPAGASTVRLPRQLPYARALELLLTGDLITAEQALEYGFLNYVVPREELMDRANQIAQKIAANGPVAVRAIRESARACLGLPESEGLALEAKLSAPVLQTEDAIEGPRAFLEKRTPVFKGR